MNVFIDTLCVLSIVLMTIWGVENTKSKEEFIFLMVRVGAIAILLMCICNSVFYLYLQK